MRWKGGGWRGGSLEADDVGDAHAEEGLDKVVWREVAAEGQFRRMAGVAEKRWNKFTECFQHPEKPYHRLVVMDPSLQ